MIPLLSVATRLIYPQALIDRRFSGEMIGSMFMKRLPQANIFCLTHTHNYYETNTSVGFSSSSVVKNPPDNVGEVGSILGLGRSLGERDGNPLQFSCVENLMDRGAWWAPAYGVAKRVGLSLATKEQQHIGTESET